MILETLAAQRARRRPWAETVYLLRLTLMRDQFAAGGPSAALTLRLSDRVYRYPEPRTTAPFEQWLPLVLDWGTIGDALNPQDGGVEVAAFDVTLDNTRPIGGAARFSDLLRAGRSTGGYDLPFSPAELLQVFRGLDSNDRTRLFRLVVEELGAVTDAVVELHLSGIELVLEDRNRLPRITTDLFPFAAPGAVGQSVPLLMGNLRRVPLLFVRAGLIDKLRLPIKATEPGDGGRLVLSTPDIVRRFPPQGLVQLKIKVTPASGSTSSSGIGSNALADFITSTAENIEYNGTDPATASLLGIKRGARSTLSGEADPGTDVYQVLDEFWGVAGINLGPSAASAFTAVYCDGMAKEPTTPPQHTFEIANTTVWPGESVNLVKFQGVNPAVPATPWATAVEIKEIARVDDGRCYLANHVSGVGNEFTLASGIPIVRAGTDAPCGMPSQQYEVWIRFVIGDLDPGGAAVVLRFFRGVYSGGAGATSPGPFPPGHGMEAVQLVYRTGWVGPIAGGHGSATTITHLPWYTTPMTPAPVSLGTVLEPGAFLDQYVFVDVTAAVDACRAAGSAQLVLGLSPVMNVSHYYANWYAIGAGGNALPALMLGGAVSGAGALLTRPNVGTASSSAAEASLGQVTVDISGPAAIAPDLGLYVDLGLFASHGLGWADSADSRPGHGPLVPILPPITCASGAAQGDNYCEGPPSFEEDYSHLTMAEFNALNVFLDCLCQYWTVDFEVNVVEYIYGGIYRASDNIPGSVKVGWVSHTDAGLWITGWELPNTQYVATYELVAFNDPASEDELHGHTHDTIAAAVRAVLGTYTTDNVGPQYCDIGTTRFFGWRIRADSYPPVPAHHAEGRIRNNYTLIRIMDIQFFTGDPD